MATRTIRVPKERGSEQVALIDKLRGGYYTSRPVAEWLCDWAIRSKDDAVLEPSCGDGAFLRAASRRLRRLRRRPALVADQLIGVEFLAAEAEKARLGLEDQLGCPVNGAVITSDFFRWCDRTEARFDCAVGNPPFIRYQSFPEPSRGIAMDLLRRAGLKPNKLTNIWVPFVVGAVEKLVPGGRLAFVLPAELLQVSYAGQLRGYLADRFERIEIVACNHLFFEHAQQEVVLLLAHGRLETASGTNKCLIDLEQFDSVDQVLAHRPMTGSSDEAKAVNHDTEKWLKYFLTASEIAFMRELNAAANVCQLSHHGSVDVGVVTGRNQFFVVSEDEVKAYRLRKHVIPLVSRAAQLRGSVLRGVELEDMRKSGDRVLLFSSEQRSLSKLGKGVRDYVRHGETEGFHLGYKCSIRSPWYMVPSIWQPDAYFFRQIYDFPRIVVNRAKATSTDTIHRMRCHRHPSDEVVAHTYTHLTAASAEIVGRSYGGGVLELEPTEAERLLMPRTLEGAMPTDEADGLIRQGRLADVLDHNDREVLRGKLHLTKSECERLKAIWTKMRNRRISRKRR